MVMSLNVFITRQIPEEGIKLLKKYCQTVEVNPYDRPLSYDELLRQVKGRDAILTMLSDKIDERVMSEAADPCLKHTGTSLKIIANYAVGYDNIDVKTATKKGIIVTNTPG